MAAMAIMMVFALIQGPNPNSIFRFFRSPLLVYGVAAVGLVLSLWLVWFALQGLLKPKPAVVLSEGGAVVDGFSGRFSANWSDFSGYAIKNNSILVLLLKDLDGYIAQLPSGRPQQTAEALSRRFGSPFIIETGMLQKDMNSIQRYISVYLEKLAA